VLPNGTHILYRQLYTLVNLKEITLSEGNHEFLCVTSNVENQKYILEKFSNLSLEIYFTHIGIIEAHVNLNRQLISNQKSIVSQKLNDPIKFIFWHDRLGHPGTSMMRRIVENLYDHSLANYQIPNNLTCVPCSRGKLITRPSFLKIKSESPTFSR
jgi:hypothetical protein